MKDIAAVGHLGPRAAASTGWPRNGACDATAAERHAFDRANQAALTLAFLGSHGSHPVGSHPRHTAKKHSTRKWGTVLSGAGGGTRTHMMLPSADFESATSTNSITPAYSLPY